MAENSNTSYGGNLLRAGLQGVSFGFADELEAMARAAASDRTYQQEVKDIREDIEEFRETNPVAAYGAEIAGAIPTGVGLGIGLLRAGIGTGIRGAAKLGAIEGGIYGAGEGEGVEGTIKSAAIGMGIGAVGGAAGEKVVQAATPAAKRIYGRVREALSREPESSVARGIGDILGPNETFTAANLNYQRSRFGWLTEDELVAEHDLIGQNYQLLMDRRNLLERSEAGLEGAAEALELNDQQVSDSFEQFYPSLAEQVTDPGQRLQLIDTRLGTDEFDTQFRINLNAIRNEMAGRRGTELEQLTPDQAALYNNQFDPITFEDVVDEADEAAFAQQLQGDDGAAPQAQARVDLGDEAIPPMPLSLMQSTSLTPLNDGINPPVQLGIGALDEAPGLHANNAISIGSMPDQFGGTVMHYSPVATSFEKLVLNPKGKGFTASGELSARDYLAHFNNETKTPGGRSEIAGSELENILTANPDEKYTIDEMRTLIQSRVPQTVERLFLEGGTGPLAPDVTEGPFTGDLPYTTSQYRSDDRALGQERGVIVYSNSVPTIDVPGYGRIRPNDRGVNHGYYDNYPGYYGHLRFQIMDDDNGRRYLWVNEIQSNAVSNISSGSKVGSGYVKTLEDRLNAYSGANRVKIPYTNEVHEKMLKLKSMKPEILDRNETLIKQIKEYKDEADRLQNDPILKFTPTRELATDNEMTSVYKHGMRFINDLDQNDDVNAAIYNYLRDYRDGESSALARYDDFLDAARDQIVASVDAQAGSGGTMSDTDISKVTDVVLAAFDDTDGNIDQFIPRLRAYVQDSGQEYLDIGSQKMIFDSEEFMDAVDSLPEDVAAGLRQRLDEKVASHRPNMPDSGYISKSDEFRALEARAVEHFKSKLGDFYKNKFTPALEELQDEVTGETGYEPSFSFDSEYLFEDALEKVVEHVPAVFFNNQRNDVLAKLANTQNEADGIAGQALQASLDYKNAVQNEPDGVVLQQLQEVANNAINTGGNRGFQAPTPYATSKADSQFYEFATRSAIKQAEQLGLDGVIFPDAKYLSTAPGRSENPAFQKNYGNAVDKALKGFVNSGGGNQQPRVELRNNSQDPNPINFLNPGTGDNKSQFTVRGIDPNDADVAEQLVPLQDQVKQAEARVTQLDKETKALEARLEEIKNDPNEYRVDANGVRRRIIRTGTDGDMIDSESQRVVNDISNKREELRLAVERADNQKGSLQAKKDELATDYATPLRIVNFRDPVTKEAAQRPIRRAAGGMVRSGIGSMAREVM